MKSKLITVLVIVAVCSSILLWQRGHLVELREEIEDARTSLATSPERSSLISSTSSINPVESVSLGADAKARTSETVSRLEEMISNMDRKSPTGMFLTISRVLELLKDHSSDELFLVLQNLNELAADDNNADRLLPLLLMVLADVEPERTLAFIAETESAKPSRNDQVQIVAFAAWARDDPEKARAYLAKQDWKDTERQFAEMALFKSLASRNFGEALAYFEEAGMDFRMAGGVVMASAKDPALREEIWKALDGEMAPEMRGGLNSTLVVATYQESGLSGVEKTMEHLRFDSSKERDQALLNVASLSMMTAPAETMTWIGREFSAETQIQAIPNALRTWAERDFEAAGNWLQSQEPSTVKNEAISVYATTVAKLDPAAALEWSGKITEAKSRDQTRRQVLDGWHEADPDAASAWVEGQGWDAKEWLSK